MTDRNCSTTKRRKVMNHKNIIALERVFFQTSSHPATHTLLNMMDNMSITNMIQTSNQIYTHIRCEWLTRHYYTYDQYRMLNEHDKQFVRHIIHMQTMFQLPNNVQSISFAYCFNEPLDELRVF